jgi:hypothetical protein
MEKAALVAAFFFVSLYTALGLLAFFQLVQLVRHLPGPFHRLVNDSPNDRVHLFK